MGIPGIGVIGYGYWGPKVARNVSTSSRVRLAGVCDLDARRRERAAREFPAGRTWSTVDAMLADPTVDAVAICTPVSSHFELIQKAVAAGRHVLCEKPLCSSLAQAQEAVRLVDEAGVAFLVDHTFLYTSAVRKLRELIDGGSIGEVYYYDSVRINLGLFQHDVNVVWDLAPHDIAIMLYLLHAHRVRQVLAIGVSHTGGQENMAYLNYSFEGNVNAHCHVNWLAPTKIRTTIIGGSQKMLLWDENDPVEKIRIFDKGIDLEDDPERIWKARVSYRTGDVLSPMIPQTEALRTEVEHLADCIEGRARPFTSVRDGMEVVRLLEAADRSMREGRPVDLAG